MKAVTCKDWTVLLPMPVYPVIEDVGWWRGEDGSSYGEPYRNGFPRRHVLADYQALGRLAKKLGVKLLLGMVLGEWDRTNLLRSVPGATWQGSRWDNSANITSELAAVVRYLSDNSELFDFAVHGLCHEFWRDGHMERTEFHDPDRVMRPKELVRQHLQAYMDILHDHLGHVQPTVFIPPALYHSFGNSSDSMQAILAEFGIRFVVTRFARARQYRVPQDPCMGWECRVGLLERGLAPVNWQEHGCNAKWDFDGPILPLHWSNLLHPDTEKSCAVIDDWCRLLLAGCVPPERVIVSSMQQCWNQLTAYRFGRLARTADGAMLDFSGKPADLPHFTGQVLLKIERRVTCRSPLLCQYRSADGHWHEAHVDTDANTLSTVSIPIGRADQQLFLRISSP